MKLIIITLLSFFTAKTFAVCVTPISRTNIGANSVLTSTKYNLDFNTIFNRVNNLPGDCIQDSSITTSKFANGSVTNVKIADGSISTSKLAAGALPEAGRLLRVEAFTSSGTWYRTVDTGSVMVQVVGGGGASFSSNSGAGGNSSFGSHCFANGGARPVNSTSAGGIGGTASGGEINITGGQGENISGSSGVYYGGNGGLSFLGRFGAGGSASLQAPSSGGGAGGYCSKIIKRANLGVSESVTVGAGGHNAAANTTPGQAGIVIVYEYSL